MTQPSGVNASRTSNRSAIEFVVLGGSGLVFVASNWLSDALAGQCIFEAWFGGCTTAGLLARIAGVLLALVVSFSIVYRYGRQLLPSRTIAANLEVRPHKVLISALSRPNPVPQLVNGRWTVTESSTGKSVVLSGDLQADIEAFTAVEFRWNGQQFLRELQPHLAAPRRLEHLALIGSGGQDGSWQSIAVMTAVARLYCGELAVHTDSEAVGFDRIEDLSQRFDTWIAHFQSLGYHECDIILDATGGTKTASIAAALSTLRYRRVEFQYVETLGERPKVLSFNVVLEQRQGAR